MTWEKSSSELVDLFAELVPKAASVEQKKMFGWPCSLVNGNLFGGLHQQSMIFRLAGDDDATLLQLDGAGEFEPMPGRKMTGYVILANPSAYDKQALRKWMSRALEFTRALPAKTKKTKRATGL